MGKTIAEALTQGLIVYRKQSILKQLIKDVSVKQNLGLAKGKIGRGRLLGIPWNIISSLGKLTASKVETWSPKSD